jgi:hypothetical protein
MSVTSSGGGGGGVGGVGGGVCDGNVDDVTSNPIVFQSVEI